MIQIAWVLYIVSALQNTKKKLLIVSICAQSFYSAYLFTNDQYIAFSSMILSMVASMTALYLDKSNKKIINWMYYIIIPILMIFNFSLKDQNLFQLLTLCAGFLSLLAKRKDIITMRLGFILANTLHLLYGYLLNDSSIVILGIILVSTHSIKYLIARQRYIIKKPPIYANYKNQNYFLLDMDGTLIDGENLHAKIHKEIYEKYKKENHSLKYYKKNFGAYTNEEVYLKMDLKISCEDFFKEKELLFYRQDLTNIIKPEIYTFLKQLKINNKKIALVTSSSKSETMYILNNVNIKDFFDVIITEESTQFNKPHPQPYLYAIKKLNADIDKCVVFEDSSLGIESAKKAKIKHIIHCLYY